MPIYRTLELQPISDSEFAEIDSVVMGCAFATQNHFGRLFDERVYENDLAARLQAEGLSVYTQVPISLTHNGFEKTYYLDLVVKQMVYELKVVCNLTGEHSAQALNYAMLQNSRLVKLINFGEAKVRGKLLRNALLLEDRYRPTTNLERWKPLGSQCERLIEHIKAIIGDWGTHLDCRLYNEALVHHFGGEPTCLRRVELLCGDVRLGTHVVSQHDSKLAFVVTGFNEPQEGYRQHLKTLLQHASALQAIQWINLNHSCLEVTTIEGDLDKRMGTEE